MSEDDIEDELDKAFKNNEAKKNIFQIMRDEKESLDNKEERIKRKFKF